MDLTVSEKFPGIRTSGQNATDGNGISSIERCRFESWTTILSSKNFSVVKNIKTEIKIVDENNEIAQNNLKISVKICLMTLNLFILLNLWSVFNTQISQAMNRRAQHFDANAFEIISFMSFITIFEFQPA
jgi:hypothetical protein